jgi:hypothetical protein
MISPAIKIKRYITVWEVGRSSYRVTSLVSILADGNPATQCRLDDLDEIFAAQDRGGRVCDQVQRIVNIIGGHLVSFVL